MDEETLPDHLRCGRTDGRQWRCRRRVMDNLKLCEIHYLQGRHRQYREKVPESLKLQRKPGKGLNKNDPVLTNAEIRARKVGKMAKMMKRRRKSSESSEALDAPARKKAFKQGDLQWELIRMVLTREVEKRKKKQEEKSKKKKKEEEEEESHYSEGGLTRELPNGVMAISLASTTQDFGNVGSCCDVKVGDDCKAITPRYFRSKNVDRLPVGKLQVVPFGQNLKRRKRKKCHWCQRSDSWNLIKCSSCQKEFFCMDCIKERYFDTQNEVKVACPVCRGTCTCKDCLASKYKDSESKEYLAGKSRVDRILCFHYLICMLLPVLRQINEDQNTELEIEAKITGKKSSDIHIKQVEFGCNKKNYCNHCKTLILDLHRSCPSCSYSLCLSCCQELCPRNTSGEINSSMSKLPDRIKVCVASENHLLDEKVISRGNSTATSSMPDWTNCNGTSCMSCPSTELGRCGDSLLELKCIFPLNWIKEMEVKAEEIACSYDFPETSDKSSRCSLCLGTDHKIDRFKQLQEAALRADSNDNCLFCPTVLDISGDNFEHFQKHWGKGHPVVVRDMLQTTSNISWDPLVMFCAYLERSITRYENNKDLLESCLDWCEVEINIRQYFTGSLKGQPQRNTWNEMLKLKGWLSSQLFKEQFPAHFAEIIKALPLQEYMNPTSGLLNLASNLPQGSAKHDLGPYVYISYGCTDEQADIVTKLCYDSYDVVNIMSHSTDVPPSTEQLSKIRRLLKRHKVLCQRESSKTSTEELQEQKVKGNSTDVPPSMEQLSKIRRLLKKHKALCHRESSKTRTEELQGQKVKGNIISHVEDMKQTELQSMVKEEMRFFRRVNRTACISAVAEKTAGQIMDNSISQDGQFDSDTDSDSELSVLHGNVQSTELSTYHSYKNSFESSNYDRNKKFAEHSGAQWDVFRRQDVPKLLEYLKRHCNEFSHIHDYHKKMVHPILDQRFFLDNTHKMRLKEEFKIEPWTFEQHVGEAVIVPAGCPYQIRNTKCCVHVVLEFVSPENVTECIQLIDEVRLLPEEHKAKVDKLEVKKMALYSMSAAIKEMRELTCKT